jgi:hypothetical protein
VNNYLKTSEEKQIELFANQDFIILSLHQKSSQAFELEPEV